MQNKMKTIRIIKTWSVAIVVFFLITCDGPEPDPVVSLDGYWDSENIIVHINGSEGTFHEIKSGDWKILQEQDLIDIGSLKFMNITKLDSVENSTEFFSGQNLWYWWWYNNQQEIEAEVRWSETGDFNLVNDGNTLIVNSKNPWSHNWEQTSYTRVNL